VKAKSGGPATLQAAFITQGKYEWFVIQCIGCSTPFDKMPDAELLKKTGDEFLNPPKRASEAASDDEKAATDRER
jgi:hypothetical protein